MSALGSLVVKLALEHAEYVQGLDKSEQAALKFAQNAQKNFDQAANSVQGFLTDTAKNVAGAVVAFSGITSAISNTQNAIDILDGLDKAAQRTGSRVEDLSRVEQATRAVGESFGPVEQAITRLAKGLSSFDDGSNDAFRALEALNVQARDTNGNLRTSAEVFIDVTKALQGYENSANKVAIANALFGKSGAELIPTLNDIAEGVDQFSGASALSAQRAGLFNDAMAKTRLLIDNVYNGLAVELLPTLLTIVGAVNSNTNAFGSFQGVGAGVSTVLKGIAIAGFTVVDTFKRLGNEIGGRAAQLAAFASFDFEGAKFIGKSIAEDSARAKVEYDKFVNTILNGDKAIAQTMQNGGLKKTLDFTLQVPAATTKSAAATKQQVSESQRFIDALTKEAGQLGKTTFEIKRMEAARLGVLGTTGAIIDRIENETVAAKKLEEQLSRVRSITESVKTAEERFADTQRELNELLRLPQGGLSIETYNRALKSAQDELNNTRNVAKNSFNDVSQFAIQAQRNIQDAFSDGLFRAFDGDLKGMVDSFKRAIQQMIAQAISADLLGALFGRSQGLGQTGVLIDAFKNVLSGGSSIGASASSTSSLLGGITSLGGIFKDGFSSLRNLFTSSGPRGAFTGASFLGIGQSGSALANGVGAGAGGVGSLSGVGAVALPAAIAYVSTQLLKSFAGDKRLGGGFGKAINAIGDIPILGDFLPVIPLINGLFGRGPLKQKETNLIGNFTAEDFQGFTSTKFKAQGGLIVGDKVERVKIDTDTGKVIDEVTGKLKPFAEEMSKASREIGLFLDSSVKNISSSFRGIAGDLGISTAAIDNFSASINIATEKGKGFTDEQLAEEIGKVSDAMALSLVPSLNELSRHGESASETLQRIGSEFTLLRDAAVLFGDSVEVASEKIKSIGFGGTTNFINQLGGQEKLASELSEFYDIAFSNSQKLEVVRNRIMDVLKPLGIDFVPTLDQLYDAIRSGNPALINAALQIDALVEEFNKLSGETERISLENRLLQLQGDTTAIRQRELDALVAANRPLLERIFALEDEQEVLARNKAILSERESLQRTILHLEGNTAAIRELELNSLDTSNRALQERIFLLQDEQAARNQLQGNLQSAFSGLEKAVSIERSKITGQFEILFEDIDSQIRKSTSNISALESISRSLTSSVDSMRGISLSDARSRIEAATASARSGNIIDIESIRGAINTLGSRDESGFGTREEFLRARAVDTNALDNLNGAVQRQLSVEERTLNELEQQKVLMQDQLDSEMLHLDKILDRAQEQIDAIMGVDKSINTLLGAKSAFVSALSSLSSSVGAIVKQLQETAGFASGGSHLGGFRIVGERGPELEVTGPSRIYTASQIRQMLANNQQSTNTSGLESMISALIDEMKSMATDTRKTRETLEMVSRGTYLATGV